MEKLSLADKICQMAVETEKKGAAFYEAAAKTAQSGAAKQA